MENLSKTPKYLKALFGLGKIARGTSSWGNSLYVLFEAKRDESPKEASSLVHLGTFRLLCSIPQYWTCPSGCSPVSWGESESEVTQSYPTLCEPMDGSLPGSKVHGIFQARVLEWAAISFSRGSSQPRDWTWVSCIADRHFTVWATREAPPGVVAA